MEEAAKQDAECNVLHPIVTVRDLKASIDFYVDRLGCRWASNGETRPGPLASTWGRCPCTSRRTTRPRPRAPCTSSWKTWNSCTAAMSPKPCTGSTTTHTTATVRREGITRESRGRDVVMTEPFCCSCGDHRLYRVFHPPTGHPRRDAAVVLGNPVGQEHIRAYRTFAVMARRLAAAGIDAFRVDLAGVGNSSGELPDALLTEWTRNVGVAIEQIRNGCRPRWICLAGVRLSASVALLAGAEQPQIAGYLL